MTEANRETVTLPKPTAVDYMQAIDNPEAFSKLVERRLELKSAIKVHEEEIKLLDSAITSAMVDSGVIAVQYGDHPVSLVEAKRSQLSKEKLLANGVSSSVIAASTTTTSYSYVLVK